MRRPPDRGSASLWLLVVGLLLVAAGIFVAAVGAATVARHRARTAADLGALAGARALWGPDTACPEAAAIVTANGGRLTACRVVGADLIVSVEVPVTSPPSLNAAVGAARAEARAGPVRADAATASGPVGPAPPALFVLRRPGPEEMTVEAFADRAPLGAGVKWSVDMHCALSRWLDARREERPATSGALVRTIGRDA